MLRNSAGAPAFLPVQTALEAYAAEVAAMRSEGLTRGLPGDMTERFFALGFSLEQMRQNSGISNAAYPNGPTDRRVRPRDAEDTVETE